MRLVDFATKNLQSERFGGGQRGLAAREEGGGERGDGSELIFFPQLTFKTFLR